MRRSRRFDRIGAGQSGCKISAVERVACAGSIDDFACARRNDLQPAVEADIGRPAAVLDHDFANAKFEKRFRGMEQLAAERGLVLAKLDAATWDALWNEVKKA